MSSDDTDRPAPPPKKPGLLRRLFGGLSGPTEGPPETPLPGSGADPIASDLEPPAPAANSPAPHEPPAPASTRLDPDAGPAPLAHDGPAGEAAEGDPEALLAEAAPLGSGASPVDLPVAEPQPAAGEAPAPARAEPIVSAEIETEPPEPLRTNWWTRLKQGLGRSSSAISQGIVDVFAKRKLDAGMLEELEDILIRADLGIAMAARIAEAVGKGRFDKSIDPAEVKAVLAEQVEATLLPVAKPLVIEPGSKPFTILVVGVNGSGKTTTIGKLAAKLSASGQSVMLAAGDTFRAAAIEQLRVWGERVGAPVVSRDQGGDAAGLAFDALKQAQQAGTDVLLIDTAGRLQNRTELMDELGKVIRVVRKVDPEAPHAVLLVLDATVGQNALSQVEIFTRVAGVTGLIMTKLDGTARGGILVAIAEKFRLPVHFIGVGEGVDDLEPFEARDFARAIAGLEEAA